MEAVVVGGLTDWMVSEVVSGRRGDWLADCLDGQEGGPRSWEVQV